MNVMNMSNYFSGVGIGLVIAWVTGALAYWKSGKSNPLLLKLILLEFIVSVIMLLVGHLINI